MLTRALDLRDRALDGVYTLLPEEERARLERYHVADAGLGTDEFGCAPEDLQLPYAMAWWLYRHYFQVSSRGTHNLPREGAGVVVANHSGGLPFDAMMIGLDVFRHTEPPRLVRYMVDYFVYTIPFLNQWFRAMGQLSGTRRNFDGLMERGHLVGVFPEGAAALGKPAWRRYELFEFSPGHAELAARHGAPVIPVGVVGAEEQITIVGDVSVLARALGLPYVPLTPTAPLLGPLSVLPRPSRYFLRYGAPIHLDPAVTTDARVRASEVQRVRAAVATLIEQAQHDRREAGRALSVVDTGARGLLGRVAGARAWGRGVAKGFLG